MEIELLNEPQALTVTARAAIALGSSKARTELTALVLKSKDVLEVNSPAGRDEAHSFAMALVKARTTIGKVSKEAREDATKFSRAVIDEEKALTAITEPEEKRLLALRDAWDAKIAAEKEAKAAAERARVTAIHERIASIREYVVLAAGCRTAARVESLLCNLSKINIDDFEEFSDEAGTAHKDAMNRVEAILVEKHHVEQEQEKAKAEREAEAAKLKAEREAFAAVQAEAKAKADAAAAELAAERAEMQRQRDQLARERQAIECEQREAKEAAERAAYLAAIAAEPATPAETGPVEPAPVIHPVAAFPQPPNPGANEILRVVARHFDVYTETAAEWIDSIDFTIYY